MHFAIQPFSNIARSIRPEIFSMSTSMRIVNLTFIFNFIVLTINDTFFKSKTIFKNSCKIITISPVYSSYSIILIILKRSLIFYFSIRVKFGALSIFLIILEFTFEIQISSKMINFAFPMLFSIHPFTNIVIAIFIYIFPYSIKALINHLPLVLQRFIRIK